MTPRDFCYWLQGALEVRTPTDGLSATELEVIQRHLSLVFVHSIDPEAGDEKTQKKLNKIHSTITRPESYRC